MMEGARKKLLMDVADTLFAERGFHQVGVDVIMKTSGVSKTTLYKYFPTKDDLVLEVLNRRSDRTLALMNERLAALGAGSTAAERVWAIVDVIMSWIESDTFHGCSFVRAAAEYSGPNHPIGNRARRHKLDVRALLAYQLETNRKTLASRIMLISEGAIATAQIGSPAAAVGEARALIAELMRCALDS
ncbi:MAG TPA: helix-turn-helix domain-containing protein [Sphingomonas sp.]|nr:helix-turn-helix domain-containing protein [Sphingomonas sp.]